MILLQSKILTSLALHSNHVIFLGLPTWWFHYLIFISTMRDFTCHTIPTHSFTNYMRINSQVGMLIQSLNSLGNRVSTGQFLIIVEVMQWKSKAIQCGRLSYIWALSTSGGGHLGILAGVTPRYLSTTDNHSLFAAMANDYAYVAGDVSRWEDATKAIWGSHNICPLLTQFQVMEMAQSGLSTISWAEVWGTLRGPDLVWPISFYCQLKRWRKRGDLA